MAISQKILKNRKKSSKIEKSKKKTVQNLLDSATFQYMTARFRQMTARFRNMTARFR
jgi:hypothetical protein